MRLSEQQKKGILTMDNSLREIFTDLRIDQIHREIIEAMEKPNVPSSKTFFMADRFGVEVSNTSRIIDFHLMNVAQIPNTVDVTEQWKDIQVWDLIMKIALSEDFDVYHSPNDAMETITFVDGVEILDHRQIKKTFFDLYALRKHKLNIKDNLEKKK
jgi:hypothetical protein